ncbi:hypothetical protein ACO0QE_003020 [Hanseniaspora vineae]
MSAANASAKQAAKNIIALIKELPDERIKHLVSFKDVQLQRFSKIADIDLQAAPKNKPTLEEIKDILNRTKSPLGLQKSMLKKFADTIPEEQMSEETILQQIKALKTLQSNKFNNMYDVGDKLYRPAGNPDYYQRILDELAGKKKETFMSAVRTVIFGK